QVECVRRQLPQILRFGYHPRALSARPLVTRVGTGSPKQLNGGTMKSWIMRLLVLAAVVVCVAGAVVAQESHPSSNPAVAAQESKMAGQPAEAQTEANLVLPDLSAVTFLGGINGKALLTFGLIICVLGLLFGAVIYVQLKNLAVHRSMKEISELIYETCKTYLQTQGKFILLFSLIGIAGSYGVAWFGIRVNTFANSRTAFASLRGKPYPTYDIPLKAG